MSCITPKPRSGNCPSLLSWLAFAHNTDTLVLAGIYRWVRRAVSYTLVRPRIHGHTQAWVCTFTHRCTHKGRPLNTSAHTNIFVVFYVSHVWTRETGSSCSSGSSVSKCLSQQGARSVGPPGPWNTDLYVSSKKWNHPFLCQPLCVCVCACMAKAIRRQEGLALLWTLSVYYKSLLNAVCVLSLFELLPSLLLTAVFPLYAPLVSSLQLSSIYFNTFQTSPGEGRLLVG